jgi:hypothetical protein
MEKQRREPYLKSTRASRGVMFMLAIAVVVLLLSSVDIPKPFTQHLAPQEVLQLNAVFLIGVTLAFTAVILSVRGVRSRGTRCSGGGG